MNAAKVRNVTIDDVWSQTSVYQIRHVQLVMCVPTINVLTKIQFPFLQPLQQQLQLLLNFLLVANITKFSQIPIGRNLTQLINQDNTNVTLLNHLIPTIGQNILLLIGKVQDGTESVQVSGPRFQHHPPK